MSIVTSLLAGLAVVGALALGVILGMIIGYISYSRANQRSVQMTDQGEPHPMYWDPYCGREFYSEEEAWAHAIERHNAPRDGDAWQSTYDPVGAVQE